MRSGADALRRALGGLLLHVDLPTMVMATLPEKRRSAVMVRTQGVRRRLALAGFAVAAAFMAASFFTTGPDYVLRMLNDSQRTALILDWAMALAAGSMLIWPEKIAWIEARMLAPFRGSGADASPRERALVQGVGLLFLSVSTAVHFLLLKIMVL